MYALQIHGLKRQIKRQGTELSLGGAGFDFSCIALYIVLTRIIPFFLALFEQKKKLMEYSNFNI